MLPFSFGKFPISFPLWVYDSLGSIWLVGLIVGCLSFSWEQKIDSFVASCIDGWVRLLYKFGPMLSWYFSSKVLHVGMSLCNAAKDDLPAKLRNYITYNHESITEFILKLSYTYYLSYTFLNELIGKSSLATKLPPFLMLDLWW